MGYGPDEFESKAPTRVTIDKIDNGYVIEACGASEEECLFIKNLSKAPSVIARMFGIKKETRDMISNGTNIEESSGKNTLKIKITR